MSVEKTINVAKAVQVQVHATEEAIDTAMSEAANLIETYVTSRRALQLSTSRATEVTENTLKAMQALNEAQQYMTAAHIGLSRIRKHIGVPSAVMPNRDSPATQPERNEEPPTTGRAARFAIT